MPFKLHIKFNVFDGLCYAKDKLYVVDNCNLDEALMRVPIKDVTGIEEVPEGELTVADDVKGRDFLGLLKSYGKKPYTQEQIEDMIDEYDPFRLVNPPRRQAVCRARDSRRRTASASVRTLNTSRDSVEVNAPESRRGSVQGSLLRYQLDEPAAGSRSSLQTANSRRGASNASFRTANSRPNASNASFHTVDSGHSGRSRRTTTNASSETSNSRRNPSNAGTPPASSRRSTSPASTSNVSTWDTTTWSTGTQPASGRRSTSPASTSNMSTWDTTSWNTGTQQASGRRSSSPASTSNLSTWDTTMCSASTSNVSTSNASMSYVYTPSASTHSANSRRSASPASFQAVNNRPRTPYASTETIDSRPNTAGASTRSRITHDNSANDTRNSTSDDTSDEDTTQTTDESSSSSDSDDAGKSSRKKRRSKQPAKQTRRARSTASARTVQFAETTETRNVPPRNAVADGSNFESSGRSTTSIIDSARRHVIDDATRPRRTPRSSTGHRHRHHKEQAKATAEAVDPVCESSRSGQEAVKHHRNRGKLQLQPILKRSKKHRAGHRSTNRSGSQEPVANSAVLIDPRNRLMGSASSRAGVEAMMVLVPDEELRGNRPGVDGIFLRRPGPSPGYQNLNPGIDGRIISSHSKPADRKSARSRRSRHESSNSRNHQEDRTVQW